MVNGTTMDKEWSLKDLTTVVPFVASSFAFAYVVGYFYAFDIAWFAFFSFPEHLVFALRALPIAIGGSVGFLIALRLSQVEHQWKWVQDKNQWLSVGWICGLVIAAFLALASSHVGLWASTLLIAAGAHIYRTMPLPRPAFATRLYWAINLMVLSFMVGFASGNAWRVQKDLWLFQKELPSFLSPVISNVTVVDVKPTSKLANMASNVVKGRVIFVGAAGVLIYDYQLGGVRLIQKEGITGIYECVLPSHCYEE